MTRLKRCTGLCHLQRGGQSTGTASGILNFTGIILVPFTLGGSLQLLGVGPGLGGAATAIPATTVAVAKASKLSDEAEPRRLVSTARDTMNVTSVTLAKAPRKVSKALKNINRTLKVIRHYVCAIRMARRMITVKFPARCLVRCGKPLKSCLVNEERSQSQRGSIWGRLPCTGCVYPCSRLQTQLHNETNVRAAEAIQRQVARVLELCLQNSSKPTRLQ